LLSGGMMQVFLPAATMHPACRNGSLGVVRCCEESLLRYCRDSGFENFGIERGRSQQLASSNK
jgi:hypothetical protein